VRESPRIKSEALNMRHPRGDGMARRNAVAAARLDEVAGLAKPNND
jgi:hypothetical protein